MKKNEIYRIYGTEYEKMTEALLESSDLASLIEDKIASEGIKKSKHLLIGIKPNLVCPVPASFGATTHTEVVEGIINYLKKHGYDNLLIIEGSWVGDKTSEAFEYCGYNSLSDRTGVPLFDTQKDTSHEVRCGDGSLLNICDKVSDLDFLINVPVLKGHAQVKVTCALKNMKGLIPNSEKRRFHREGLHGPIAHLTLGIPQDFIVVDHICGDYDFEEGGNPVTTNCIMTGLDPVLIDTYTCREIGWKVSQVPYIGMAEKLGLGSTDLDLAEIIDINMAGNIIDSEDRQIDDSDASKDLIHKIIDVEYAVDESDSCSACYGNLAPALIRLQEEGLLERLDTTIAIGQGHEGKTGKLGVGKCCRAYETCIMGCPPDEEKIYREIKEYILCMLTEK